MAALLIGYARCSTDQQDLTAQHDGLTALGVSPARIYTAPTTRRSAPGAARRTRHLRRRSRTPDPPATPTRPRGPHSGSARESSLPAGPAPRLQNPQPMSELRNHPRKLTPNSATFTRTGQILSRPVEHCEGCPVLAGVRNLYLDDPAVSRPDLHCNFEDRSIGCVGGN